MRGRAIPCGRPVCGRLVRGRPVRLLDSPCFPCQGERTFPQRDQFLVDKWGKSLGIVVDKRTLLVDKLGKSAVMSSVSGILARLVGEHIHISTWPSFRPQLISCTILVTLWKHTQIARALRRLVLSMQARILSNMCANVCYNLSLSLPAVL